MRSKIRLVLATAGALLWGSAGSQSFEQPLVCKPDATNAHPAYCAAGPGVSAAPAVPSVNQPSAAESTAAEFEALSEVVTHYVIDADRPHGAGGVIDVPTGTSLLVPAESMNTSY